MVSAADCAEKTQTIPGNKVSKPLMEKKRRARINKCLDQLKTLLESYYSSSIRKRKLEKADILELTVKHLKNLHRVQSCHNPAPEFSDYQTGFRSCIANVNHYLTLADNLNGNERWLLSRLSRKLCGSGDREDAFSTTDSVPRKTDAPEPAQRLLSPAARPEGKKTATFKALKADRSRTSQRLISEGSQQPCIRIEAPAPHSSVHMKCPPVSDVASTQKNVWRPW